jgi:hypothetical protein
VGAAPPPRPAIPALVSTDLLLLGVVLLTIALVIWWQGRDR